jgi:peptidoglycan hydrolase-like protein with peptidoglycan-binding domain
MTAASLAYLPLQVGSVALSHAGHAALWAIQRYMRAPLSNTAIGALVLTTALASSNALYGQKHDHPAPLFAPVQQVTTGSIGPAPVIPKTRPKSFAAGAPLATAKVTAPAAAVPAGEPVGNKEVFEVQRKLASLNLFAGEVDGYYGPKTASAIRKFEETNGLKPLGQLTREVVAAILAAPVAPVVNVPTLSAPLPKPAAAVQPEAAPAQPVTVNLPQVETTPVESSLPAAATRQPLAAVVPVKPLAALTSTAKTILGRPVPSSPEQAFEMATETANEALETIVDGVQSIAMTNPPAPLKPAATSTQSYAASVQPLTAASTTATATATRSAAPVQPTQTLAALPDSPQVGVPLKIEEDPPEPGEAIAVLDTDATPEEVRAVSVTDPVVVAQVQRGLASLGFLHGPADGVAGEATAKAIRNFEVYFNYNVTGRITPELLDLLLENGAVI